MRMSDPGNPVGSHLSPSMPPLTTDSIASELLEETLLTLEQLTTAVTVLTINATRNPEQSPRVRRLLGDLVALIQEAETDLGTYQRD